MASIMKIIDTKVAGVKFENLDGTDRQIILKGCKKNEMLLLIQEPNIQFPDAIKVCRKSGEQLGYLADEVCHEVAPLLSQGYNIEATITELTGGGFFAKNDRNRECALKITVYKKEY